MIELVKEVEYKTDEGNTYTISIIASMDFDKVDRAYFVDNVEIESIDGNPSKDEMKEIREVLDTLAEDVDWVTLYEEVDSQYEQMSY